MTTETNSVLNTVKEAFAPVTEAFTKLQNLEVPEAAREFVKKQAETAKVRAADMHAGSEKVTAAIETAVAGSVSEAAKISRNIQQALYQDVEAFFAGIDKLASAKSLSEAAQIQSEMVRARGELFVSRAKATTAYQSARPPIVAASAKAATKPNAGCSGTHAFAAMKIANVAASTSVASNLTRRSSAARCASAGVSTTNVPRAFMTAFGERSASDYTAVIASDAKQSTPP